MEIKVKEITVPEKIEFNFEELKKELVEKAKIYETLVYSDEQIKEAKADRAKLNKLKAAINDERIRREREYMAPFLEFKAQIDEILGIVQKPIDIIDKQIKEYEKKEQDDKKQKIIELFDKIPGKPDWLRIEQIWDNRWLNKSVTFRMIEDNILGWFGRIDTEINTLADLGEGAFEAVEIYKKTLDIAGAIKEGKRIAEIQQKKAEAETKKSLPPSFNAVPETPQKVEEKPDTQPEQESWVNFSALLTVKKAKALKDFCAANGITIKSI